MNVQDKRRVNEKKFKKWDVLSGGRRRYYLEVKGKHRWIAKYIKEVDANEETVKFYQEIYGENGNLIEIHEKYPIDKGHRRIKEE